MTTLQRQCIHMQHMHQNGFDNRRATPCDNTIPQFASYRASGQRQAQAFSSAHRSTAVFSPMPLAERAEPQLQCPTSCCLDS